MVLEQDTEATPGLAALDNIRLTSSDGGIVPLTAIATVEQRFTPLSVNHLDQFPVTTISFNVPDNYSLGEAVEAILTAEQSLDLPSDIRTQFRGSSLAFQSALGSTVWLVVAAVVAMYIVLGCYMRELYPSDNHSLHSAHGRGRGAAGAVAGGQRAGRDRHHRHHSADRHREEERHHDDRLRAGRRARAGHAAAGGDLPALSAPLPTDPDDHPRRPARRPAADAEHRRRRGAAASVGDRHGWRPDAQPVLTLFTTPVIYLLFDRLSLHLKRRFPHQEEEA